MVTLFRNSFLIIISSFSLIFSQNHSLSFDGVDDYVELPTNENLQLINNEITFTAWVKIPSDHIGNQYSTIIGGRSGFGFTLWAGGSFDNGAIRLNICCENPSEVSGNFDLRDDQWHFISVLYDGTKYKIYVDGNLDAESNEFSTDLTVYNGDDDIKVGIVNHENANEYFHGQLDEIGFWNKALTNDEIINFSNNSLNGNEEGLVGYWNFNDPGGTTLTDVSGNGNHGTINGATWSDDVPPTIGGNNAYTGGTITYGSNPLGNSVGDFSYSFWVKLNKDPAQNENLFGQNNDMLDFAWQSDRSIHFMNFFSGYQNFDTEDVNYFVPLHEWTQIVFTRDAGLSRNIYINGSLLMSVEDGGGNVELPAPFVNCESFSFDEFQIWDYARSEEEIANNLNILVNGNENGLVGYWRFDEGNGTFTSDISSGEIEGHLSNLGWVGNGAPVEPIVEQPSPNHSLSFDGDGDYVVIEDASSSIVNSDASLIGWFKINDFDDLNPIIGFRNYPNDYCSMYAVMGMNGTIETMVYGNLQSFIQNDYSLNQWYHIALIFNGETFKTYLDGELAASVNTPSSIFDCSDTDLFFGGMQVGDFEDLNGGVDDVSLWTLALTEDQILSHMNTPLSGDESGLVGYWNFNDGEGSTLTDLSGNGNDGTIYGATWSDDGAPVQPLEELDTIATITLSEVDTYIFPGYIGDTALVAVNADLGNIDLYSSKMRFTGFQGALGFEGILTEGTPMGDADWNVVVNEQESVLITSNYGSTAINGEVTLFYLKFSVGDSLEQDTISIELADIELNEEEGVIETFDGSVIVSHLLFGDVTMNGDVSSLDAANILRYLVGIVEFDQYKMSAADVTMDESISALDASVIAQYDVELIQSLPHSEGTDGQGFLTINSGLEYQPGEILEIPVMLTGGNNLLSFEVDLIYDPNQVTVEGIDWSDQIDHFMIEENNEPGSIRVAGSGTTPDGQEGLFATLRAQVLETTTEQSIDLTINKIRINESAPVEDVMVSITQEVLSTDNITVPTVYALHQNYPNPFNPTTKISYDLPEASVVSLSIYDLMGREIRTIINSEQTAGFKNIQWNATDNLGKSVPAGMYIYTIQAGEFRQTRKMVLLK